MDAQHRSVARALLPLCVLLLAGTLGVSPARASNRQATGLVVVPHSPTRPGLSYLQLTMRAGSARGAGTIELLNPTARTLRLALVPVDAITLDTLGSTYSTAGARRFGAARWLRVSHRLLTLRPRARATVAVAVHVPRRSSPGDYLAGISVEVLHQHGSRAIGGGASAVSAVRYAIGVEISLPGRRRPLIRFGGAAIRRDPAGLSFLLTAHNLGNAILQHVHGRVEVRRGGRRVLSRAIAPGTFLAHTSISYPAPAHDQHPGEGTSYDISAWLRYGSRTARLRTTVAFGHRAAAVQRRYAPAGGGGSGWWKDALLAAVCLYMVFTTALLLRHRAGSKAASRPRGKGARNPPRLDSRR